VTGLLVIVRLIGLSYSGFDVLFIHPDGWVFIDFNVFFYLPDEHAGAVRAAAAVLARGISVPWPAGGASAFLATVRSKVTVYGTIIAEDERNTLVAGVPGRILETVLTHRGVAVVAFEGLTLAGRNGSAIDTVGFCCLHFDGHYFVLQFLSPNDSAVLMSNASIFNYSSYRF